ANEVRGKFRRWDPLSPIPRILNRPAREITRFAHWGAFGHLVAKRAGATSDESQRDSQAIASTSYKDFGRLPLAKRARARHHDAAIPGSREASGGLAARSRGRSR